MKSLLKLSIVILMVSMYACSPTLTPFSQKLVDEYKWNEDDLRKIQFYLSDDIVLRKRVENGESTIEGGKIKMINGEKVEEIKFKAGTPGVLIFKPKEDRFAISFEDGDNAKFLVFGPSPKFNNRFVLMAKEWDRNSGKISYEDRVYTTSSESAFACLMVDLDRARKHDYESRVAKGRKIE